MQEPTLIEKQTRKFVVTNPSLNGTFYQKGDIVEWEKDFNCISAYFKVIGCRIIKWSELEFADEEFRVGDTVEIVRNDEDEECIYNYTKFKKGGVFVVREVSQQGELTFLRPEEGVGTGADSRLCKLISRAGETAKEEKPKEMKVNIDYRCLNSFERGLLNKPFEMLDYNKPNNKTFMENVKDNIVEFAKNLTLSADEKALRQAGLHDSEGNWTSDARIIVLDKKAVQIGFKDREDLARNVGVSMAVSAFELNALFTEFSADLLAIAKAKIEDDKSK